ncbi:hypothetical protein A3C09_04635 [Candidatus Uhrbacteria bacterium RIFCSPHIGHO2_02_FULL_47_44]|uniref:TNase-like domain-containing protein n=1 Tax=Candidatus Uhrbacteria bacterium RIFCSPLOWO2_02_FULL_48_18 TaxID=1802408 RepID=A0A1F7VCV0_9BACT|nr:MAG: hypothetical protein A2839_04490 [Candidatus Uhrbacteria bacterium RIFCSPHIGHO2_01_FULL_47_10]OGL71918.1 MAG: hypothetical protein A3C09_04635 [Candidatus Uhrbacteria bacterium RIFCSPHIGHO2_02_FULL_47_44]OGL77726.1 MAG: hypothetical protein A3E97_00020 [Candidatus Uhrbacteria bacterium RIFCSPHIGHO2_12_FULL_47_12]OGL80542.1 MAG: hypothetical protein A3B20_04025 [Candidatus Uhrbacteria bacterium RIFCSPLOWO2_01_FULL_47_17]OGL88275.1 MAG: hypothetical protein A3I41_00955 [Candidatus Uhrbact
MSVKSKYFTKLFFYSISIIISIASLWFYHNSTDQHTLDKQKAKIAIESQVIRVVDGDTIIVALNHKPETVRLLGVNTPETVAPNRPVQCFGPEASAYAKNLMIDRIVKLESDPSQDNRDRYDRLLRFVFLEEMNINKTLIQNGFAREYTYKIPYQYQKEFRAVQKIAKKNKRGLWGACPSK